MDYSDLDSGCFAAAFAVVAPPDARIVFSIAVRSGGFGDDELRDAGAIGIYDTPGDLAADLDNTPLA